VYRIEVRAQWTNGSWSSDALGWPNVYATREAAETAVETAQRLRRLGSYWADAEFRVAETSGAEESS
jgi:hypothetical protein